MALALIVLAIGSVVAGWVGLPGGSSRIEKFLEPSFTAGEARPGSEANREETTTATEALELGLMGVSIVVAFGGIGLATFFFLQKKRAAGEMAERFAGLHGVLLNKYYVDEIYDAGIVQPIQIVSQEVLWKGVDVRLIDGAVNGVGDIVSGTSESLRRLQSGSVRAYAASVFFGVVLILGYYLWR